MFNKSDDFRRLYDSPGLTRPFGNSNNYTSNYRHGNLFDSSYNNTWSRENPFEIPNYLKSIDTYKSYNRYATTPSRHTSHLNRGRFEPEWNSRPEYNNSDWRRPEDNWENDWERRYGQENWPRGRYRDRFWDEDEWAGRNNYLGVSNSPNLRFNGRFYNPSQTLRDREFMNNMKNNMNYLHNTEKLNKIKSNLDSTRFPSNSSYMNQSLDYGSGLREPFGEKARDSFADRYNLSNGLGDSHLFKDALSENYDFKDALRSAAKEDLYGGVGSPGLFPRRALYELDSLNIDELYNKVKQQKQQLLLLKSNL